MIKITPDFINVNHWPTRWGYKPIAIVNHITAGSAQSCRNWFKYPGANASSHYLVSKDGTIYQFLNLEHSSWANGTQGRTPTGPMYAGRSTAKFVKDIGLTVNANIYTVSIEHENKWGGDLTPAQLESSAWLHAHIVKEVKRIFGNTIPLTRDFVVGHCEIDPVGKSACPGVQFPYEKLIKRANEYLKGEAKPPQKPQTKPGPNPTKPIRWRIVVGSYPSADYARKALVNVKRYYPQAWILRGY